MYVTDPHALSASATAGTTPIVVALVRGPESGRSSPPVIVAAVAGALPPAAFVAIERRGDGPPLPLGLLRVPGLVVRVPEVTRGGCGRPAGSVPAECGSRRSPRSSR
ncbi:hypothetical protein GCM10022252_69950 [Streptosporangium oxazolinicum]|uniref:Uncharacterized protein n=1 Tax=Streptosporangium oxazolinicum TaxID=909287 RepID=A0ABP8BHR4_9ACTN